MSFSIRTTEKAETMLVDVVDAYAVIESDQFLYFIDTDLVEELGLLEEGALEGMQYTNTVFDSADIVIRKNDKKVTKSRWF